MAADITAFTLFYQPVKKGWQMSVQRKDQPGWSITMIPEAQARIILDLLKNSGHPDGPWEIRKPESDAEFFISELAKNMGLDWARIVADFEAADYSVRTHIERFRVELSANIEARRKWTAAL